MSCDTQPLPSPPLTDKERMERDGWTAFTRWKSLNNPDEPDIKYYKKFPLTGASNSEEEFMLACMMDHENMPESLKGNIPLIQVCLSVYMGIHGADQGDRYALNVEGQLDDGSWCKMSNYVLPSDLDAVLACIPRLLRTWRAVLNTDK